MAVMALNAEADTFVRSGTYATRNYGLQATVNVANGTGSNGDMEGYLRFDTSSLGAFDRAELVLTPQSVGTTFKSSSLRVRMLADSGDAWVEGDGGVNNGPAGEMTWNSRPVGAGVEVKAAGAAVVANRPFAVDVTALVRQATQANGLASFHLDLPTQASGMTLNLHARSATTVGYRPVLRVTTASGEPVAVDDSATTAEDTAVVVPVLVNDLDPEGGPLVVTGVTQATRGATTLLADGTVRYAPQANFHGSDSFRYTIRDSQGLLATASVTVAVTPVNDRPVATADTVVTRQGTRVDVRVLANDVDVDGDSLTVTAVGAPAHGTATINADGTIAYTPAPDFVGSDSFAYTIRDSQGAQATASVFVQLQASTSSAWPQATFAPYVDATLWPYVDLVATAQQTGQKHFVIAFITADVNKQPAWGGVIPMADDFRLAEFQQLRAMGGEVMVSFGGAAGTELAAAITDVNGLTAAYQSVIDRYELQVIDFDIEGAWVSQVGQKASIDRRSLAMRKLQDNATAAGKSLDIWLTLPVLPSGLTADGMYVVQSALAAGVQLAGVNIMAMDYGSYAAPSPEGNMGEYAIQAGNSLFSQLKTLHAAASVSRTDAELWRMVGVTPMIGQNDVLTERFYAQDAVELLQWAEQRDVGLLSMWSLTRDKACSTLNVVSPSCSGIAQQAYEFTRIFDDFTGSATPSMSIQDARILEGNSGSSLAGFVVRLSSPQTEAVSVNYATVGSGSQSAASGVDYTPASGTLVFAPGEVAKTIQVSVIGETVIESDETFAVELTGAVGVPIADGSGLGTILDDDTPLVPKVSVTDVAVLEGNSGSRQANFEVRLSAATTLAVSVPYATRNDTATAGTDYLAVSGTLVFAAGETVKQVAVPVLGDVDVEGVERLFLDLGSPVNGVLEDALGIGSIQEDDAPAGVAEVAWSPISVWSGGFTANLTIKNVSTTAWSDWYLEFDCPYTLANLWNATVVSRVANRYRVRAESWNGRVQPGAAIVIGYEAAWTEAVAPTNLTVFPISS